MDRLTRVWQVITELNVNRSSSAVVSMGSKIVLLGGNRDEGSEERSTWDAFDVISRQWASSTLSAATRRLPRNDFYGGCAVVVPQPSSSSSGNDDEDVKPVSWTDVLEAVSVQELERTQHIIRAFDEEEEVGEGDEDDDEEDADGDSDNNNED